jgi:hypothetical protein
MGGIARTKRSNGIIHIISVIVLAGFTPLYMWDARYGHAKGGICRCWRADSRIRGDTWPRYIGRFSRL